MALRDIMCQGYVPTVWPCISSNARNGACNAGAYIFQNIMSRGGWPLGNNEYLGGREKGIEGERETRKKGGNC